MDNTTDIMEELTEALTGDEPEVTEDSNESEDQEENNELIPPEGHKEVGNVIAGIFNEIISYRDEFEFSKNMTRYYNLRCNKHWKFENSELNLISANMLGTYHKKTVNQLTDNNPTFNAVPDGDLGEDAQDQLALLTNVIDTWWTDTEQQSVLEESVYTGELYGFVGEYVYPDQTINFPTGDISVDTLDPMYFSLYPPEERKQRKAVAFIRWYEKSVKEAKRLWPESADEIVPDMSIKQEIGDERNQEGDRVTQSRSQIIMSTVQKWIGREDSSSSETSLDKTYIFEIWVRDYSTKMETQKQVGIEMDELGRPFEVETAIKKEVAVYPGNIRRIEMCNGGNVILSDGYNPSLNPNVDPETQQKNYLYSRFPISYIQPVPDPSSPFGHAEYKQLEKLNTELDKALTQHGMYKDKVSRSKLMVPRDSGVNISEMDNKAGIIQPTNAMVAAGIKYIDPPNMGADIPAAIEMYKSLFQEISGRFEDITQGQTQGQQVVAAQAIALLLEKEAMSISGKGKNYQKMIRERGRMFIALAQQWYSKPRFVTLKQQGKEVTKPITKEDLQIQGKINVVSGSTMPVSHIQKREETLTLAKGGFVDQEYVLEKFDVKNYQDIILRMQQGPLGQYLEKLAKIGIPEQVISLFQQIGSMPDKEFEKALKEGQIPTFEQIVQQLSGQKQPPKPDPEMMKVQLEEQKLQLEMQKAQSDSQKKEAEINLDMQKATAQNELDVAEFNLKTQETNAKIQKINADTALAAEKIKTELVDQEVKANGIKLDWESIKIEKAKAVAAIQSDKESKKLEGVKIKVDNDLSLKSTDTNSLYSERGLKSNNEDI